MAVAKFRILREIFDIAREQRAQLSEDRIDVVLALMEQRDGLMRELEQLVAEMAEIPENVIAFPSPIASDWTEQDRLALDTLIRGILEHDQQNEQLMSQKMAEILQEVPRLHLARRVNDAYSSPRYGGNYVDLVS